MHEKTKRTPQELLVSLRRLSDDELVTRLRSLAASERRATAFRGGRRRALLDDRATRRARTRVRTSFWNGSAVPAIDHGSARVAAPTRDSSMVVE